MLVTLVLRLSGMTTKAGRKLVLRSESGNVATIFALLLPVLLGLSGGAVDFYIYLNQQRHLQSVADSAALAAAREASLEGWSHETAQAVVEQFVQSSLRTMSSGSARYSALAQVDRANRRVSVSIEQDHYGYFVAGYFKSNPQIRVTAVAQASGSANVCVIGLNGASGGTISLDSNSRLSASECAVYSNSIDPKGLQSLSNSILNASLACSAGGYEGASRNYSKLPLTDCPAIADPLSTRPAPAVGSCKYTNLVVDDSNRALAAGTYCGGVTIKGNSRVKLAPGVFVIKDGPLIVDGNSKLDGLGGVGLYFMGKNAYFEFKSNASVDLAAPTKGEMAGLLVHQDRNAGAQTFKITSNYTRKLIGTIYLPNGDLVIDATNDVADQSAFTAIVVKRLHLRAGPNLVLNTDYEKTTVPVPDGLGPENEKIRLVH